MPTPVILSVPTVYWICPSCEQVDQVAGGADQSRLHPCPALRGMSVPMVLSTTPDLPNARHVVREREDYLRDHSNPVMSVVTEYADGHTDCVVYPETAKAVIQT